MSQEKIDRYKKEKANRKQIMKKQRRINILRRAGISLIALALVGWLGFSVYQKHDSGKERPVAEVDYNAINNYMTQLGE
ncbi:MAG: hypothetical protein QM793_09270 [Muricomes sp.]